MKSVLIIIRGSFTRQQSIYRHISTKSLPVRRRPTKYPHASLGPGIPDPTLQEGLDPFLDKRPQSEADIKHEDGDAFQPQRKALPRSPLMDLRFLEARENYHRPKARPRKNPTDFQRRLAKNPYALALSTPVRRCSITNEALPRFFLEVFAVLAHPTTGLPCWVPRNLSKKRFGIFSNNTGDTSKAQSAPFQSNAHDYMLSRETLISALQSNGTGYRNILRRFASHLRQSEGSRALLEKATFRLDMGTFILSLMRQRIVEEIVSIASRSGDFIVACDNWDDAKRRNQIACFLYTACGEEDNQYTPGEFACLMRGQNRPRLLPVYDLKRLLGEEQLGTLRDVCKDKLFTANVLVMRHKRQTMKAQMMLWKLEGYEATHIEPG